MEKNNLSLAGMRSDDDWVLTPMSNEPLRLRNKIGHELWSEIHDLPHSELEPEAESTISAKYIDLFLNGKYRGIYLLMERVDRKLLQLKPFNGEQRVELYKGVTWGATQYYGCPAFNNGSRSWSGFEMDYPKEEDYTDWEHLYSAVNLVVNETDDAFNLNVFHEFQMSSSIDYFLFLNLLRATDNLGKNVYVAKYDQGEPYFFVPWDLDGILGTQYAGQQDTVFDDILTNGLFDRLILNESTYFLNHAAYRWYQLREAEFSNGALEERLCSQIDFLNESGAYDRESIAWPEFAFQSSDKDYMLSWIADRLAFLDDYFSAFVGVPEKETSLNIFPNPTSGIVWLQSNNGPTQLKLYNSNGQMVLEKFIMSGTNRINLDELESGIYHLVMIGDDNVSSQSVIVGR
ncbi:MAG: spore coat protein H [Flavobacteriales bacterium]